MIWFGNRSDRHPYIPFLVDLAVSPIPSLRQRAIGIKCKWTPSRQIRLSFATPCRAFRSVSDDRWSTFQVRRGFDLAHRRRRFRRRQGLGRVKVPSSGITPRMKPDRPTSWAPRSIREDRAPRIASLHLLAFPTAWQVHCMRWAFSPCGTTNRKQSSGRRDSRRRAECRPNPNWRLGHWRTGIVVTRLLGSANMLMEGLARLDEFSLDIPVSSTEARLIPACSMVSPLQQPIHLDIVALYCCTSIHRGR